MKNENLNRNQKLAIRNIKYACYDLLGGLENTMMDYSEDSEEYQNAEELLSDHETLTLELYNMAICDLYGEGYAFYDCNIVKQIRFCGKDWLMEQCSKRLEREGY